MQLPVTQISRLIASAISRHASQSPMDHGTLAVQRKLASLAYLPPPRYTDATRPDPASVPAGAIIYNEDDEGINVSNGVDAWRGPSGGWVDT
jgi:hypothetical protein